MRQFYNPPVSSACFCHDVDHRGTNNDFLKLVDSPLAQLYSTSTLERHHLELTQDMLEMEDHRLLENLTSEEYRETLIVIKEAILATDLKEHFRHLKSLEVLAAEVSGEIVGSI
jgi:disulfide oxidoreductase YuzD